MKDEGDLVKNGIGDGWTLVQDNKVKNTNKPTTKNTSSSKPRSSLPPKQTTTPTIHQQCKITTIRDPQHQRENGKGQENKTSTYLPPHKRTQSGSSPQNTNSIPQSVPTPSSQIFVQPKTRGKQTSNVNVFLPPPKSIEQYGESNVFEIKDGDPDDLTSIKSAPNEKRSTNKKVRKSQAKEEKVEEEELDTLEFQYEGEPVYHIFATLPLEVVFHLMSFLDMSSLCKFSLLSKFCCALAEDDVLWKPLFFTEWSMKKGGGKVKRKKRKEPKKGEWRSRYIQARRNKVQAEKDKLRKDALVLAFYMRRYKKGL